MSRSIALVLGICVFSAHSAVHRTQDATLNRIARSPHYGSSYHHDDIDQPPPPPHGTSQPPVVYHTQNWSGVAKGLDGAPQGVFSGAAASAQSAAPAISEAFSIASSGTGTVSSDKGAQVKIKSRFGSHSNEDGIGSHSSGSFENKYGGASNDFGSSSEGQYNVKSSGLDIGGGVSRSGSEVSKSQPGKNGGATGVDKVSAEDASAGHARSSGQFKSVSFDRESGQRSINSGFSGKPVGGESAGYESQSTQYGSSKTFSDTENCGDIGSESLTDDNSAGRASADFDSQSAQHNLQTSNNGFNRQSGQFTAGSGFGGKSGNGAADSNNQFGRYNGQTSRSGYQRGEASRGFESHGGGGYGVRREFENHDGYGGRYQGHHDDIYLHDKSNDESNHFEQNGKQFGNQGSAGQGFVDNGQIRSTGFRDSKYNSQSSGTGYQRGGASRGLESDGGGYGVRREFENHSGYGGSHPDYDGDIHRHGKNYDESHRFGQNGKQFGNQGSAGQGFGDNGQIRSTGFGNFQSSSFGSNRGNHRSGSSGYGAGYSGNLGQVEQSGKLDATSNQGGPQDFSGAQQVQQSGQLNTDSSASQTGSQGLSGGQSLISSGASRHGYKNSGSSNGESKGTLVSGNANGGISPARDAEGSLSAGVDASGHEDVQSTLGSALNLASQGLQAAQRAPCATCDKGSYALSNAKSHSGSAIALSIGG